MACSNRSPISAAGMAVLLACACDRSPPAPGVSLELAQARAAAISDLAYDLHLVIPESKAEPVTGTVTISFVTADSAGPLVLDFRAPPGHVKSVTLNGAPVKYTAPTDHIVIPAGSLTGGAPLSIAVEFVSTDAALNRHDDFCYSLFVPDRASTAFPVFEQPDLKASLTLKLTIPAAWKAVSNGSPVMRDFAAGTTHTVHFAPTAPISTYLFSFAAGLLAEETAERDHRTLTMFHRETDSAKVARNRETIFDLHATALRWLESYTGITYPFEKVAFFAVPAFQFGGMEHPGAVWYRAESLFLDPTASRNQELGRASLIAHETAHMWFGDLVTMRWFDDVWMKEVFANFMAAKIAGPSFPDINLDLRFFQAHHPSAYGVDRTPGTNPIRQRLENLREAGSLYGAIIYQKAPIVMRQLETLVGDSIFREGMRRYLDRFRYGNAAWPDLIAILDELSLEDLAAWSRAWVEEPGRPTITVRWADSGVVVSQADPRAGRGLLWSQPILLALGYGDSVGTARVQVRGAGTFLPLRRRPELILPGADGVGYGRFPLDSATRAALLRSPSPLSDPVHRAVAWQALWEEVLDGLLAPRAFLDALLAALTAEREELVALQLVGLLGNTYWRFLTPEERAGVAPLVERVLWAELERAATPGKKGAFFNAIVGNTLTPDGAARLERIWRKSETPRGLPLAEQQYVGIAEALAVRGVPGADAILDEQERRITNPDRRERFRFVRRAWSADRAVRDSLFRSLTLVENRRRESWVLDAQAAMNHPLRTEHALTNLRASLELGEEIQRTGDIFFPLRWFVATLDGHQSPEAAETVRDFLAAHPDYPPRLRGKLLQAADELFRAVDVLRAPETR
jgi:aminopeptidase N